MATTPQRRRIAMWGCRHRQGRSLQSDMTRSQPVFGDRPPPAGTVPAPLLPVLFENRTIPVCTANMSHGVYSKLFEDGVSKRPCGPPRRNVDVNVQKAPNASAVGTQSGPEQSLCTCRYFGARRQHDPGPFGNDTSLPHAFGYAKGYAREPGARQNIGLLSTEHKTP